MRMRCTMALVGLMAGLSAARAQEFRIEDAGSAPNWTVAQLKPGVVVFSDRNADAAADETPNLTRFDAWARGRPVQKRFLALFPGYKEPTITKVAKADTKTDPPAGQQTNHTGDAKADATTDAKSDAKPETGPVLQKLYMYVAQARFVLARPPAAIDLSRDVTLSFLERIDPAIKHTTIAAADVATLKEPQGTGNLNPDRAWCTGRPTLICIQSIYKLEGKIPLGIMLVNKLRESAKQVADHIDFDSELSQLTAADVDQAGLKALTGLDTPVAGALEQNIFYVNQIMKFGKFFAVFQAHPGDPNKTVVTAFMALAIDAGVLDKKREFEKVPVLHNLVPAQVLMGQSSFNSGQSISAGLPSYARNEIRTIAGILERDKAAK